MSKFKKVATKLMAFACVACTTVGCCLPQKSEEIQAIVGEASNGVRKTDYSIDAKLENFFDEDVVSKLPASVLSEEEISLIVSLNSKSVMDAYDELTTQQSLSQFAQSCDGRAAERNAQKEQNRWIKKLKSSDFNYEVGVQYDTILNGFELIVKAKDFEKVNEFFGNDATIIVGETYMPAQTQPVMNDIEVYETGIFDSSKSRYQGDGVVVAVLDTGLDYTHTAFSVDNFSSTNERFTLQNVSAKVGLTEAAKFTAGLTGEDVYMNAKVPFAYDYADKDPDVLPINSDHGTHVAGIIAGKDDTIVGVAPNAQLAIMKVFSDTQTGAKTSWILAGLEDCANLNVDVVNMSLGSGCGFAREVDEERINVVYDRIRDTGISLVVAAGNDYIATQGSEKNGSLNLTSNPDAGPVGSPSTYAASLSVASVDGVKTPYFLYNDEIIYFTEASTSSAKTKDFVDDILNKMSRDLGYEVNEYEFEYVTIPGLGRASDYAEDKSFYEGKIVLVKRGTTTFEEKVRIALKEKGAAGIIIYNNVSGAISMSVGADVGAVCSLAQDEGEMLADAGTGKIKLSRSLVSGPFMSDFSSWGPTSDLQIKPEITAHGGEILSAVPGQAYDRLSGTSMAAPNQAGATALIRQYVRYSGKFGNYSGEINSTQAKEVTAIVNQLMMSTTDIISNKNGLPYAVRKQGSGLVNIAKATNAESYIKTYDRDGALMDKAKLEVGDDKKRTGVYNVKFEIDNISSVSASYDISAMLMTEGVSETYTSHGDTTVTQMGRMLDETKITVNTINGSTANGNLVTVGAGKKAVVTATITLSKADKQYIEDSFEHGMFVEGFIKATAKTAGQVSLNVPLLAFYGDWTEAPIFDEEYYDTHKDEINKGIDPEDKLMADAYATRVIGSLYSDYICGLGEYYFSQDPGATQIAASKEHIAISNQANDKYSAINGIRYIAAGLLRNVKQADITIVDDVTGEVIFERTEYNIRKSNGIGTIYYSSIDVEFSALEQKLKNNTRYTVTVDTYIDYGAKEDQKNVRNRFEFPLYVDFQAPAITDVVYRTEYDKTTKKTRLFADLSVYDNHYAMGLQAGQIIEAPEDSDYTFTLETFGKYINPVYSSYNSTSTVTVELTDFMGRLKNSVSMSPEGKVLNNSNSFIAMCYDYALNSATYEIQLPDEVIAMYFTENEISLSPNETKPLRGLLEIYPMDRWIEMVSFESSNKKVVDIVNQTIIAKTSGTAVVTAKGLNENGEEVTATLTVKVLAPGDAGYKKYDVPAVNKFTLTGYKVNEAYYGLSSDEREIGETDGTYSFGGDYSLSMFPSESVTLAYALDSNFPEKTTIEYKVGNSKVATVSQNGTIVAQSEGSTVVSVNVKFDGKSTLYSGRVAITVKDPFITQGMYLNAYKGLGGTVTIPDDRGITMIQTYAFSNYEYVDKDLSAGDVINDEDPFFIKPMYIGDAKRKAERVKKVIIPEGVTSIEAYAFAGMIGLEEVVLPKSLNKIGMGAFLGCTALSKINLENVKFINKEAFAETQLANVNLSAVVAIGDYSFRGTLLTSVALPESSQSLGVGAFKDNQELISVTFDAPKIKIGDSAFENCKNLTSVDINASVIAKKAFYNCSSLSTVAFGEDVAVFGEYAFAGTNVAKFETETMTKEENGAILLSASGEVILVAPKFNKNTITLENATSIGVGAFSGKTNLHRLYANNVTAVGAYAFADCTNLSVIELNEVETIGDYAFYNTGISATPNMANVSKIGNYAFAKSKLTSVAIPSNIDEVGEYAFSNCDQLGTVTIEAGVVVGKGAFASDIELNDLENFSQKPEAQNISIADFFARYYEKYTYEIKDENGVVVATEEYYRYKIENGAKSKLHTVTIGDGVVLGDNAFDGNIQLINLTIGDNVVVGNYAFYNANKLTAVDLSGVKSIGEYAFSGANFVDLYLKNYRISYAYEQVQIDGEIFIKDAIYSYYTPDLVTINLSSLENIGAYAFADVATLNEVVFGTNQTLTTVAEYAFANTGLSGALVLPESVTSVGQYAFYNTNVSGEIDLTSVKEIGAYAFANCAKLTKASLKEGVILAEGAFSGCEKLTDVENLGKVVTIGARAFEKTALTVADITSATYVGDFAFGESAVTSVVFGTALKKMGENPFYACSITTFEKEVEEKFNGVVVETRKETTYDITPTIKVIDDALYQVMANGTYTLVTYPQSKQEVSYSVAEGTARISARAFAGSAIESVVLPSTLKAIGDRAFYDCQKLTTAVFKSYESPLLEEEYLPEYASFEELPFTGELKVYEGQDPLQGLGIVPFYMWNATSGWNNYYYGANFVSRIGHTDGDLVMVKPANGKNYDSFIFSQYFGSIVAGSNAAMDSTLVVIGLIDSLPEKINLDVKEAVEKARAAYNSLPSLDQKALVTNYETLTKAESMIEYLETRNPTPETTPDEKPIPEAPIVEETPERSVTAYIVIIIVLGVATLGLAGFTVVDKFVLKKKKGE